MKKTALLLALALLSTMVFAGCGYTNQNETATNDEGHNMVGTTWVLTDFNMESPVKSSEDGSLETSDEVSPESGTKPPSGEELAEYLGASLEFNENDKVTMITNFTSKEFTYSHIHNQEGGPCISVTGDKGNTLTAVIEDDTMIFSSITGSSLVFERQ